MRPVLAGIVLALFASAGCHNHDGIAPAVPRTLGRVARESQEDLQCHHIDQVVHVMPGVVQVRGCGARREYVIGRRREPITSITDVERRASVEMRCPESTLLVESPAPAVRAVTGCERVARFDLICHARHCDWTMTAHTGRWAGIEATVPEQFQVGWELPSGVAPISVEAPGGEVDLSDVALPPPPDAVPAAPETGEVVVPPPP